MDGSLRMWTDESFILRPVNFISSPSFLFINVGITIPHLRILDLYACSVSDNVSSKRSRLLSLLEHERKERLAYTMTRTYIGERIPCQQRIAGSMRRRAHAGLAVTKLYQSRNRHLHSRIMFQLSIQRCIPPTTVILSRSINMSPTLCAKLYPRSTHL